MGLKRYITYWNAWEQGNPFITVIPTFSTSLSYHSNQNEYTAKNDYGDWFDLNLFYYTANYDLQQELYFYSHFDTVLTPESGTKLYFAQNTYILFGNASYSYYLNDTLLFTANVNASQSNIRSLPSYNFNAATNLSSMSQFPGTSLWTFTISTSGTVGSLARLQEFYDSGTIAPEPTDEPYENGGFSDLDESTGGDGDYNRISDVIPYPDLPTLNIIDTGFVSVYNPTKTQLKSLANYMWNNTNDFINVLTKLISNPLSTILGLHIIPFEPQGTTDYIKLGNVNTNIQAKKLDSTNFLYFDCGTVTISKYFNAYLDFAPYTKTQLYLPFIGYVTLDTDDIISKPINLRYYVDVLTGACTAIISVNGSVLYQFSGNCAYSIPITGTDLSNIISSVLSIANTIVGVGYSAYSGGGMTPTTAMSNISNTVTDVMSMHPNIERSGGLGGSNGLLGVRVPYFCINYPHQNLPAKLTEFQGYPLYNYKMFSDISGYTVVMNPQLNNMSCTENELNELLSLLQNGVIF